MFRNVHFDKKDGLIHLWEQINGENIYSKIKWQPYVFIHKSSLKNSKIKSLDGKPVIPVKFKSYNHYIKFIKDNTDVYEDYVKPEIQFLVDRYYEIPDEEIEVPNLKIFCLDIEVFLEEGFPSAEKAQGEVCLITVIDHNTRKKYSFGLKQHNPRREEHTYFYFEKEKELLLEFFKFFHKEQPDIVTGWNIYRYDILYLINRSRKLFGADAPFNLLSPIKVVSTWNNSDRTNIDIAGVSIIDYLDLYKRFSNVPLESYRLDFVSNYELEKGKLDWTNITRDFRSLYREHWDTFVDYNVIDTKRVSELEDKLGFIKLAQQISLFTRCPIKFYEAQTALIEGAMLTYFRRNNLCAPKMKRGHKEYIEGAFVKDPQRGKFNWVVDLDITSCYPTAVSILNMSTETFIGRIKNFDEKEIIEYVRTREFPPFTLIKENKEKIIKGEELEYFNKMLKKKFFSISPVGVIFNNKKEGCLASMVKDYFRRRLELRKKILELKNREDKDEIRIAKLAMMEKIIKRMINAVYGAFGAPWSRYFNQNIAESVTACGRHMVKSGEKYVNEILNEPWKCHQGLINYIRKIRKDDIIVPNSNEDFVIYIDTDSLFFSIDKFANRFFPEQWNSFSLKEREEVCIKIAKFVEEYVNKESFTRTQREDFASIEEEFKITFKQELVARSSIFVQKKKYSLWKVNEQGISVDEIHTRGLDIVKSDCPEGVKEKLKEIVEMILKNDEYDFIEEIVEKHINEFYKEQPENIAANISVNNIEKYITKKGISKGTPWHIKGVFNYRKLISLYDLENKYESIGNGEKCKVAYLKDNEFNMESLSFKIWPKELEKYGVFIDYDKQIEKHYLSKLETLFELINKKEIIEKFKIKKENNKRKRKNDSNC